ncbi:hypothetical protein J6590_053282, partial [Homalodisca vitripennis]
HHYAASCVEHKHSRARNCQFLIAVAMIEVTMALKIGNQGGKIEQHPDKNDDPAAEDKFVEITQAYEVSLITLFGSKAL